MATRFATRFSRTGAQRLVREFGDSVTYYANNAGAGREIQAMVERDVQVIENDVPTLATVIRVRDDATYGISSTEIDTGVDTIAVSLRVGETAQRRQIVRVMSTENGLVRFMVN